MLKESKYIIRRILIGVGIVIVLGFLNGCKVKALSWSDSNMHEVSSLHSGSSNIDYKIYFNSSLNRYYFYTSDSPNNYNRYRDNANELPYVACLWNSANSNSFHCVFSSVPLYLYKTGNTYNRLVASNLSSFTKVWPVQLITNSSSGYSPGTILNYDLEPFTSDSPIENPNVANNLRSCNYDVHYYTTGNLFLSATSNYIPPSSSVPLIESLQPLKVNQDSYIVAYIFRPKFSSFDTDNFIYQYRVGKNGSWLNISQNEEQLTINNNNIIYFRILDKSNNDLVDSQTFTITDIGTLDNNINYSIDFSTDYETLENTNIISKYFVNINYLPKSSILKYQYQFVLDGSSLDNNNWVSLDSEVFSYNFETTLNGTLYARILDSDDNVLTTGTFTITEIGKFAINNNDQKNKNFFDKISSSINFSGPISGIINIPINLIRVLSSAIASNTCTNYNLGSLWGTNLVIPCVNIKQHLGNSLYFTIDLICACVMIYYIFKMFGELYTNLLFMHKNPIQDLGRRGD